jgi:hypothetical protein
MTVEGRSAPAAEIAKLTGRRFIAGEPLFSGNDREIICVHRRIGGESRPAGFSALPAMTVIDAVNRQFYLILNVSAQAASAHCR